MGLFDRFRRGDRTPPADPPPAAGAARHELTDWLQGLAGPGFLGHDDVVTAAIDAVEGDPEGYPGLTAAEARRVADEVWSAALTRQESWSDEGDYTPLSAAFADLAEAGIVARMDFTCCQTCGHAEIADERPDEATWGYAFFHQQDSEGLEPGGSDLFLAFGTFRPVDGLDPDLVGRARDGDQDARQEVAELSDVRVATLIADTLRRHGLRVDWDGTARTRICVTGLDWRKRLPA